MKRKMMLLLLPVCWCSPGVRRKSRCLNRKRFVWNFPTENERFMLFLEEIIGKFNASGTEVEVYQNDEHQCRHSLAVASAVEGEFPDLLRA